MCRDRIGYSEDERMCPFGGIAEQADFDPKSAREDVGRNCLIVDCG